tara:strand:+ start:2740 stop:3201 length:462 start_codon:yes stop_codon:yes gene_type:complete
LARYNNRRIISSQQTIPVGKLLPGMIITFNYSEAGVTDPRPILLFLHNENNLLEGLNINYVNPTKVKKLFQVIEFKKGKLDEQENLMKLKESYFRILISSKKKRTPMTTKRFYGGVVSSDEVFRSAYRSYKVGKLTALKVANIHLDLVTVSED